MGLVSINGFPLCGWVRDCGPHWSCMKSIWMACLKVWTISPLSPLVVMIQYFWEGAKQSFENHYKSVQMASVIPRGTGRSLHLFTSLFSCGCLSRHRGLGLGFSLHEVLCLLSSRSASVNSLNPEAKQIYRMMKISCGARSKTNSAVPFPSAGQSLQAK